MHPAAPALPRARPCAVALAAALAACGGSSAHAPTPPSPPTTAAITAGKDAALDGDDLTFIQDLAWSPDSRRLAFSLRRISGARWKAEQKAALANTQYDVYVIDADGRGLRQLTDTAEDEVWVSWYPDGRRLSFATVRDAQEAIYTLVLDGAGAGELERLTEPRGGTADASWSPDGKQIVYSAKADTHTQLYIASLIGTGVRQLTREGFDCRSPLWSPDGRQVIFQGSARGAGKDDVFVLALDTAAVTALTDDDGDNIYPGWMPDGRITFTAIAADGKKRVVVRMPLSDKRETLVQDAFFARVSPDGRWIAYVAGAFPDTSVYVRPIDPAAKATRIVD